MIAEQEAETGPHADDVSVGAYTDVPIFHHLVNSEGVFPSPQRNKHPRAGSRLPVRLPWGGRLRFGVTTLQVLGLGVDVEEGRLRSMVVAA